MLRAIRVAVPILVLAAAVACGGGQSEAPQQASAPPPDAKTVDPATAGAISGKIAVDGQLPPNPTLSMKTVSKTKARALREDVTIGVQVT